jgi:hypothetical protein
MTPTETRKALGALAVVIGAPLFFFSLPYVPMILGMVPS